MRSTGAVDDVIDFSAAGVDIRLQYEHDVVRHAEAFADDWHVVAAAAWMYRHAYNRL